MRTADSSPEIPEHISEPGEGVTIRTGDRIDRRWLSVVLVTAAIAISYFDRQTLPVAIAESIVSELVRMPGLMPPACEYGQTDTLQVGKRPNMTPRSGILKLKSQRRMRHGTVVGEPTPPGYGEEFEDAGLNSAQR